jgi:acid phosphatase
MSDATAANDLNYHRSLGYGNEYAATLGMPWVSASARLLTGEADTTATNSSAGKQHVFISFTHREEPPYIVTALGLYNESNATMPATSINYERAWKTSQILPFLANIALERLSCNATQTGNGTQDYVRALVNSAPIPIPGCIDGPDGSCALSNFTKFIAGKYVTSRKRARSDLARPDREKQYGNFVEKCGVNATNATSTLGIYEGQLPAHGAAIEVATITLNGSLSVNKKKGGSGGGNKGNNTSAATTLSSDRVYWLSGAAAFAAGALIL